MYGKRAETIRYRTRLAPVYQYRYPHERFAVGVHDLTTDLMHGIFLCLCPGQETGK